MTKSGSVVDAVMSRDESRGRTILAFVILVLSVMLIVFHLETAAFISLPPLLARHFMMSLVMVITFLSYPFRGSGWAAKRNGWFAVDLLLIAASVAPFIAIISDLTRWESGVTKLTSFEIVMGTIFTIALLEATRRLVGFSLAIVAVLFIVQNMFAPYLPPPFYGPSMSWAVLVHSMWGGFVGIFGTTAAVVSGYLILFFLFAGLLEVSGGGTVMIRLAMALAGRYTGGPAKVAIVGSTLFGTLSGSPVANVTAVGTFTIPMMKSIGFKPEFAAAVEAASSTGGQFVPPVLGITAFVMPQFINVSYFTICLAVLIPAFLYYLAVFLQVHFEAKKLGLEGLPKDKIPNIWAALKPAWVIFIPIAVVFGLLWYNFPMGRVALYAALVMLACGAIARVEPHLTPRRVLDAFHKAAQMTLAAGVMSGTLGIIIACFYASGVGDVLARLIVNLHMGMWIPLILTGILCIILGMGVVTLVIYILMVITTIPSLIALGVPVLSAHMFAFFLGVSSGITPPVCATSYVAAVMANGSMIRTALQACKLAIVAFLVPFMFVAFPELLMVGSPVAIVYKTLLAISAVVALAVAIEGYLNSQLKVYERVLLGALSFLCFFPQMWIEIGAFLGIAAVLLLVWSRKEKYATAKTARTS